MQPIATPNATAGPSRNLPFVVRMQDEASRDAAAPSDRLAGRGVRRVSTPALWLIAAVGLIAGGVMVAAPGVVEPLGVAIHRALPVFWTYAGLTSAGFAAAVAAGGCLVRREEDAGVVPAIVAISLLFTWWAAWFA